MYIDVILIENIVLNYLILYITSVLVKYKSTFIKIFVGSLVGALYVIPLFVYNNALFNSVTMKFMLSALMIVIVFHPTRFKEFIRLLSYFYLVSLIFGGVAFALYYSVMASESYSLNGIFVINDFPVILIIATILLGSFLIFYCIEYVRKIRKNLVQMEIIIENNYVSTCALIDTGNTLYEPISHIPVIIVEFDILKEILPEKVIECISQLNQINSQDFDNFTLDQKWLKRFRLVPFKAIGKENGMLLGFKPDGLKIKDDNATKVINDVVLGIYFDKLSQNNEYGALLHPDLLSE